MCKKIFTQLQKNFLFAERFFSILPGMTFPIDGPIQINSG